MVGFCSARTVGILELLASGIAFGFLGLFGKWSYALGMTPGELLSLRFLFAAGAMLALLKSMGKDLAIGRSAAMTCVGLGVLGYAVFASCYFQALRGISASLTVLLLYLYPAFVALGSRIWFGERLSAYSKAALGLASVGLVLLVYGEFAVSRWESFAFGIGAAVFYSMYILVSSRRLGRVSPMVSAFYIQLSAGIALSAFCLHDAGRVIELVRVAWLPLLGISLVSTVLAMALFLSGLQKVSASEASILSAAEPLTAIIAAAIVLGERMSAVQWGGAFLVLGAFLLISLERPKSG